jgi:uncharacterized protein YukE
MVAAIREAWSVAEPSLVERVEKLEKTVDSLAKLPGEVRALGRRLVRVEARSVALELLIVQLRSEMNGGFSAIRGDLAQAKDHLLEIINSSSEATQSMFDDLSKRLGSVEETVKDTATAKEMRQLHDDLVQRIADLRKGGVPPNHS